MLHIYINPLFSKKKIYKSSTIYVYIWGATAPFAHLSLRPWVLQLYLNLLLTQSNQTLYAAVAYTFGSDRSSN